jgi:hypothetical protein
VPYLRIQYDSLAAILKLQNLKFSPTLKNSIWPPSGSVKSEIARLNCKIQYGGENGGCLCLQSGYRPWGKGLFEFVMFKNGGFLCLQSGYSP